jgi:hypothetical protein
VSSTRTSLDSLPNNCHEYGCPALWIQIEVCNNIIICNYVFIDIYRLAVMVKHIRSVLMASRFVKKVEASAPSNNREKVVKEQLTMNYA